ncbi:hypothetical protein AAFF_G00158890 [Aldrovandia affinis]|uniref:Uncharacterized protein n=1 Tax=Aldrovandia affinis TaxID=143900 RepID=A0AAD7W7N5_9TELE|nr:hypothetical protein AAFF_G00158890 [Aldrovandia affinis]
MQTVGLIHTLEQCLNRMQTVGLIHTLEQCLNRMQTVGLTHTLEQCLNRMQTGPILTVATVVERVEGQHIEAVRLIKPSAKVHKQFCGFEKRWEHWQPSLFGGDVLAFSTVDVTNKPSRVGLKQLERKVSSRTTSISF